MRGKHNIQKRNRQRTGRTRKASYRAYLRTQGVNVENIDQRTINYPKSRKTENKRVTQQQRNVIQLLQQAHALAKAS